MGVAAIERSLTNACLLGNLMHTDILNASLGKQLPSHPQDSLVKIGCLTPFWPPAHPCFHSTPLYVISS
jgi:hypothetical protein